MQYSFALLALTLATFTSALPAPSGVNGAAYARPQTEGGSPAPGPSWGGHGGHGGGDDGHHWGPPEEKRGGEYDGQVLDRRGINAAAFATPRKSSGHPDDLDTRGINAAAYATPRKGSDHPDDLDTRGINAAAYATPRKDSNYNSPPPPGSDDQSHDQQTNWGPEKRDSSAPEGEESEETGNWREQ